MQALEEKEKKLRKVLLAEQKVLVAYSGGVDSGFLLWFATQCLGDRANGVLADSPSLKRQELADALDFAKKHRLRVKVIQTEEMGNIRYTSNPLNRCYYCKFELFDKLTDLAQKEGYSAICYGENADDTTQNRPGRKAAREFNILAPLQEVALSKSEIRELASRAGLEIAGKVAQPCLASRIVHGEEVTDQKLKQVEAGERLLQREGFRIVRLRHHGSKARVQVSPQETSRLLEKNRMTRLENAILRLGFSKVEFDPEGYRGASLPT